MSKTSASKKALVTGSCGLIGSEVCLHLARHGFEIYGIDNNERSVFFGPEGDTRWSLQRLKSQIPGYQHHDIDIRNREGILKLVAEIHPNAIIHTAAQPSHDRAAAIPFDDFDTNAVGTLNFLEAARRSCPESPFVHMSTNKVYGDRPNSIALRELDTRWDYADPAYKNGIAESFSIDQSKHSIFGASKVAADVMVQEYGRYFNMPTCCLRGGCLTGPNHSGVELHGFLSYLIRCNIQDREYKVFGYKGKQVRDNIHSEDVANFIVAFCEKPRVAEVYNIGGGKDNSCSILEAFKMVEEFTGKPQRFSYVDQNRIGDHICYYSDLRKMKADYPGWTITRPLRDVFREITESWNVRLADTGASASFDCSRMKVLITGACGFVGSQLAEALATLVPGLEIVGFDNLLRAGSETNRSLLVKHGVQYIHGDVRMRSDMDTLPSCDWVIDAAANPSVLAGIDGKSSSRQLSEHNLGGTLNMIEYCRDRKAGLILLSTSRVYSVRDLASLPMRTEGNTFFLDENKSLSEAVSAAGITEKFPTSQPISLYGATKLASEIMALEYGLTFDFPVWIDRCGVLAGAGQFGTAEQGIFSYWLHAHAARLPLRYIGFGGYGHQVRDAFHPADLAALIALQLQRDPPADPVYNVSGGAKNSMSLAQLTDWCNEHFGLHQPQPDVRPRPFDIPWMVMDHSRTASDFGWSPKHSLQDILTGIAAHVRDNPGWLSRTGAI